jgi:hypothetical protein
MLNVMIDGQQLAAFVGAALLLLASYRRGQENLPLLADAGAQERFLDSWCVEN